MKEQQNLPIGSLILGLRKIQSNYNFVPTGFRGFILTRLLDRFKGDWPYMTCKILLLVYYVSIPAKQNNLVCEPSFQTRDPRIVQSFKRKCKVAPVYLKIAVHASGPGLLLIPCYKKLFNHA